MREFFRCVAEAVMENGVKGLAQMVPGGGFAYSVAESAWKKYKEKRREKKLREDIVQLANLKFEEAKQEAVVVAREVFAQVPVSAGKSEDAPNDNDIITLQHYLTAIPEAIRQSLKRPEDPSGTTAPADFAINNVDDIVKLLPVRPPQFRDGDAVPGKSGWILDRLLGIGGFGEVWFTRHRTMASLSGAIKFCLGKTGRDLIHEADLIDRVMQAGHHPNIVPLKDAHLEGETPWLLFEYVGGGNLADWMHTLAAKPQEQRIPQVIAAIRQLADAVAHFHSLPKPIVHRDFKPSNILLDRASKKLRITDFGIGSVSASESNRLDRSGLSSRGGRLLSYLRGSHTPVYSSPQQRHGDEPDPRDDVHALGVIAYQMITGRLDSGPGPAASRVLKALGIEDGLTNLILDCTSEELEYRPNNGKSLVERLAKLGTTVTTVAKVPVETKAVIAPVPASLPGTPVPAAASTRKAGDRHEITLPGGVKIAFAWCPPGTFLMGSNSHEGDEKPVHEVRLTKGFWTGVYPVTRGQFAAFLKAKNCVTEAELNGGGFINKDGKWIQDSACDWRNPGFSQTDEHPVVVVSWNDAQDFTQWVADETGEQLRLLTEAEWEYACRAGTTTDYHNGNGEAALKAAGWFGRNSGKQTHPVGELAANGWGLHDCHGNVFEWCSDWLSVTTYRRGDCTDPTGPTSGSLRVLRGGSWYSPSKDCRAAFRDGYTPKCSSYGIGFRLARVPSDSK